MDGGGRYLQPMTAYPAGRRRCARRLRQPRHAPSRSSPSRSRAVRLPPASVAPALGPAFRSSSACRASSAPASPLGFFAAVIVVGLWQGGHLDGFIRDYGEPHHALARAVGLGLEQVTISGIAQMRENEVLAAAGINSKLSLAFLDVNDVRERLERVPLIKSATVRKLYPNELVITLTEREPHAIWQHNGELFVIAADGTVIDLMQDERFVDLPFVVGERRQHAQQGLPRAARGRRAAQEPHPRRHARRPAGAGRSRWTTAWTCACRSSSAADALARLVKLEREQKILEKDVLGDRSAHGRPGRRPPDGRGGRRPAPRRSRRNQCAARGSIHESLGSGFDAAPEAAVRAQERHPVGARHRHEQGRLRRRRAAAGRRGRVAARPHPCGAHPRHRPSALRRPQGRRRRRSRSGRDRRSARRCMRPSGWRRSRSSR